MVTGKHIDVLCAVITVLAVILTVLFMNGEALGIQTVNDGDTGGGIFTDNDLDGDWDASGSYRITLTNGGADISGGAYFADGVVHIVSAGRYLVTGTLDDGRILVEANNSDKIWLCLAGASVTSGDGAAIEVEQAEKVFLTLKAGTENSVTSREFTDTASGVDGAVYSRDDLTVNGSGTLTVNSAGHGIVGNDDLVIAGGEIDITASEDGIHANDSVRIRDARITVNAGDDGVTVSNDEGTGYFYMESGTLTIPACYEGVEGQEITVAGGDISVVPTDDGFNARETTSAINISGGSIRIVNENGRDADGLDSNGSIYITGGYVFISMNDSGGSAALDAGTESGGECRITGGTVVAAGSGTMAEGFDSGSAQGFIMESIRGDAGARVTLTDGSGAALIDETIPCAFSSLLLSAPGLEVGDSVTLGVDGAETGLTVTNRNTSGTGFGGMGGLFGGRGGRTGQVGDTVPTEGMTPSTADGGMPETGGTPPDMGGMTPPEDGMGQWPSTAGGGTAFPNREDRGDLQRPAGETTDGIRGGFTGRFDRPQDNTAAPQVSSVDRGAVLLTLISAAALLAGIFFAMKVKH